MRPNFKILIRAEFKITKANFKSVNFKIYFKLSLNKFSRLFFFWLVAKYSTITPKIIAIDEVEQDVQEIVALVPESEIMDYATYLKAMTQGSGFFNRQFEDYEEVPENLKEKIIKAHQKKA